MDRVLKTYLSPALDNNYLSKNNASTQVLYLNKRILSDFFQNENCWVVHSCNLYLQEYRQLSFSLITHYEILSGLKHRDAQKQLDKFLEFSRLNQILLLTEESVTTSAKIYADLRKKGTPLDDIDLLIAGVAIANNLVLITHNQKHFSKIEGLELEDWTL